MGRVIDEGQGDAPDAGSQLELVAFVADVLTPAGRPSSPARTGILSRRPPCCATRWPRLPGAFAAIGEAIAGVAGSDAADSPLVRLESGVATVKAELGDFATQGESLGGIMDSVAETISGMAGAAEAIEEVGSEIELIAINASIKAAHTGEGRRGPRRPGPGHPAPVRGRPPARPTPWPASLETFPTLRNRCRKTPGGLTTSRKHGGWLANWTRFLAETAGSARQCQRLFATLRTASASLGVRAEEVGRGIDFDRVIGSRLAALCRTLEAQIAKARILTPGRGQGTRRPVAGAL